MNVEEIIKNNALIKASILVKQAYIEALKNKIIAPCEYCPFDGQYRCQECADNCFEGFNVRDYPFSADRTKEDQ